LALVSCASGRAADGDPFDARATTGWGPHEEIFIYGPIVVGALVALYEFGRAGGGTGLETIGAALLGGIGGILLMLLVIGVFALLFG
jgi:hypothetical protein